MGLQGSVHDGTEVMATPQNGQVLGSQSRRGDCLLKPQWVRKGQAGMGVCCQEHSSGAIAGLEAITADSKNRCCLLEFHLCNNSCDISPPPCIFIQCVREILRLHLNLTGTHIHGWQIDDFFI